MKNFKWIKCRWNTPEAVDKKELGLEINDDEYELKFVFVDIDKIAFIDEYQGFICINFSANLGDILITNIPYTKYNIDDLLIKNEE